MKKDIVIPAAGESVTEADIVTWHKNSGDFVEMDDPILELETDKASMDLTAEVSGVLAINVDSGTVKVGDVVGCIDASGTKPAKSTAPKQEVASAPVENVVPAPAVAESAVSYATGHPSPAARKAMEGKGISPADIKGSGKDGRITKADVLQASSVTPNAADSAPDQPVGIAASESVRGTRTEKLSRLRKTLMHRLVESQQTTASLTTFNEIDMYEVMEVRKKYKEAFKDKYNIGLGFMSFFTKAVTIALKEWPIINATIEGEDVQYYDYCDIGIAVSTPKGLVVPVVRDAETLSFAEIETQIKAYALKGRDGKITIEDMTGGTFTITNGGTFGSMLSTPILNRPQSAILGMHNIVQRPMVVNGEIKARPIMYVALTYDHRLIDGAEAVQFLVKVKQLLEDPTRLVIGL